MTALKWQFDHSYARLPEMFYVEQPPKRVREPRLILFNHALAESLGLDAVNVNEQNLADVLSGASLPDNAKPLAQAYAGHQFGHFTMLGDGRALLLGEQLTPNGQRLDVQLKGSGPTVFSRQGDGLAGLGPMLREYVVSEAMHALGIPTTRSLAVVATGERVRRETVLDGAALTRIATSHLRVGTFQYAAAKQDMDALSALVDFALARHDPQLLEADNKALALLEAVVERQAHLIVQWMRVGFIHGVMNTDNTTISGETIDYGPCAFMDAYDPKTVFSSIDRGARYAYDNQPAIVQWNLARLAEALLTVIDSDPDQAIAKAEPIIHAFKPLYLDKWQAMMGAKLGFNQVQSGDEQLFQALLETMHQDKADYTNTFVRLGSMVKAKQNSVSGPVEHGLSDPMRVWVEQWLSRLTERVGDLNLALETMQRVNPIYIPRNHQVEQALSQATQGNDLVPLKDLLQVLARPYEPQPGREAYTHPGPSHVPYQTFCGT